MVYWYFTASFSTYTGQPISVKWFNLNPISIRWALYCGRPAWILATAVLSERFRLHPPIVAGGAPSIFLQTGTASPPSCCFCTLEGPCAATIEGRCVGGELETLRSRSYLSRGRSSNRQWPRSQQQRWPIRSGEERDILVLCKPTKLPSIKIKHPWLNQRSG